MTNACCETAIDLIPLSMLKAGSRGIIKKFNIDCNDVHNCRFVHRLKEMGVYEGASVEVIINSGDGEIVAVCEGTRIVLGRGMANKINIYLKDGSVLDDSRFGRFCRKFGIGCRI